MHPDQEWPTWKVIQIQGKQDEAPIPEYRQRINEYMTYLREKEGVQVEWHPTEAIRPGGQEDYISDMDDATRYYEDYQNGNYGSHDYPSVWLENKHDPYDEYGLPRVMNVNGLAVSSTGLENLVLEAVRDLSDTPENRRRRNYYDGFQFVDDPEEAAKAILFLVEQLKIREQQWKADHEDKGGLPGKSTDWDAKLQQAIEEGWAQIDKERDEMRDNNWEFEHDNLQYVHNEIWDDYNREHDFEEGDEGYVDPEDKEFDWEHPEMQRAQEYIDKELYEPWNKAVEFIQALQAGNAIKQDHNNISLKQDDREYTPTQEEVQSLPGAFSRWTLSTEAIQT
jgi:hypothetical protein